MDPRIGVRIPGGVPSLCNSIVGMANYDDAVLCLRENINLLMGPGGVVPPENQPMWNLSNALLVFGDALKNIEQRVIGLDSRLDKIEQKLRRLSQ